MNSTLESCDRMRRMASTPSISGIRRSISMTSGPQFQGLLHGLEAASRLSDDRKVPLPAET